MSLMEMMIAMAIFSTVTVIVAQSTLSANQVFDQGMAQDDVAFDSDVIIREIRADMVRTGWHIPDTQLEASGQLATTAALDRQRRYYPYVQQQAPAGQWTHPVLGAGLGNKFTHTFRPASGTVLNLPDTLLPGKVADVSTVFGSANKAAYYASFHARSQELIFVRANLGSWSAKPWTAGRSDILHFGGKLDDWKTGNIIIAPAIIPSGGKQSALGVLYPSGYKETGAGTGLFLPLVDANADGLPDDPYGVAMTSGVIDNSGELAIKPYWETMSPPTYGYTTTGSGSTAVTAYTGMGADDADIREYMYCVVPSKVGLGRLVRAVKIPTAAAYPMGIEVGQRLSLEAATGFGMVVDRVLSDNVVRVVFDTSRTTVDDATTTEINEQLGLNQVRVRLFFARRLPGDGDKVISQIIESVVSMHAKLGRVWAETDSGLVGKSGLAFPF